MGSARRICRVASRALLAGSCRLLGASGIAAFAAAVTGCYTYPSRSLVEVPPTAVVSAQISDVGRVALAEPVGSGVDRIDGQVVQNADTAIRLMVTQVRFLNGLSNKWQGQELTLRPLDVKSVSQRTFSRQRTVTAMVIGALAAAALLRVGFTGLFSGEPSDGKLPDPPPEA
jgi:hypothetical protein